MMAEYSRTLGEALKSNRSNRGEVYSRRPGGR